MGRLTPPRWGCSVSVAVSKKELGVLWLGLTAVVALVFLAQPRHERRPALPAPEVAPITSFNRAREAHCRKLLLARASFPSDRETELGQAICTGSYGTGLPRKSRGEFVAFCVAVEDIVSGGELPPGAVVACEKEYEVYRKSLAGQ